MPPIVLMKVISSRLRPRPTGTAATPPTRPSRATPAAIITITWRGLIPIAFRVAVSRTRSRVLRSRVLKTPAIAITVTTAATMSTTLSMMLGGPALFGSFFWTSSMSGRAAASRRT